MEHNLLFDAFIYLIAAVISVPIAARLGLGSVLGYLIAGIIIGPFALKLVVDSTAVLHFAEFGVVMLLFLVGLDLNPGRLWRLRIPIFGTGGVQLCLTTFALFAVALLLGLSWHESLAVGMMLALSSTAIVIQTLHEKGLLRTPAGRGAFAVLLFQDIAVIPIFTLLPLLGAAELAANTTNDVNGMLQALMIVGVILGIVFGGHFLVRPLLNLIAKAGMREIFVAAALALVVGTAIAMQAVGLSPALGTFLAGVVLAESEYRHELEVDIEPFKGLLLGLFFISVGASIDFSVLSQEPLMIAFLVAVLIGVKLGMLLLTGRLFNYAPSQNWLFSCSLSQAGEFAFVLASFAITVRAISRETADILFLVVSLSMVTTPLLMKLYELLTDPRQQKNVAELPESDHADEVEAPVIIAGFGRFGQMIGRLLHGHEIGTTVLEHDASHIEMLRKYDFKVYYGDAQRVDLLRSAGAMEARLLVIALDDPQQSVKVVKLAKKHFPHLKLLVRAIDRAHAQELMKLGVDHVERETLHSAISLGVSALAELGMRPNQAYRAGELFKRHDERILQTQTEPATNPKYLTRTSQYRKLLGRLLTADESNPPEHFSHGWEARQSGAYSQVDSEQRARNHKDNKSQQSE